MAIDDQIDKIVDRVEQQALARRDASTRQAELAVKLAIAGGIGALALALGFTALTVRSITAPLKQLDREHRLDHRVANSTSPCRPRAFLRSRL